MIVTKKGENGIETMMPRPDKTRIYIIVNGEIDASKTILNEGTVIMAARTTRENGVTRKTAGEKAMEGGEDTVTQPLRQTVDQTSLRNGFPITEETHDGQS